MQGTRPNPTLAGVDWIAEFGTFFRSFWGLFGGVNVFAPQWFYAVCNLLFWAGLAGLLFKLFKTFQSPPPNLPRGGRNLSLFLREGLGEGLILPTLMVIITMILLIRWTIISPAFQGRLLFPALIGVNLLWVLGLRTISGRWALTDQNLPAVPLFATLFLLIMAIIIPFTHIAPAYAYPQPVAVPEWAEFGPITYTDINGESISLVGVDIDPGQTAVPNDQVGIKITLYWTTQTGVSTDYVTAVHALGRGYESVGQVDRHPGWGMWPPTRWQPGEIYADPYHVWVNPGNPSPSLLRMDISVSDTSGPESRLLTTTSPAGDLLDLTIVGQAKLGETIDPDAVMQRATASQVDVDFADFITLNGISMQPELPKPGSTLSLSLFGKPMAPSA